MRAILFGWKNRRKAGVSIKSSRRTARLNRNPSRGQRKNIKFSRPAAKRCWPLLCGEAKRVLFHRRRDAQIALDTSRVVIANILLDHLDELVLAGETPAILLGLLFFYKKGGITLKTIRTKILSLLLALVTILSLLPTSAFVASQTGSGIQITQKPVCSPTVRRTAIVLRWQTVSSCTALRYPAA